MKKKLLLLLAVTGVFGAANASLRRAPRPAAGAYPMAQGYEYNASGQESSVPLPAMERLVDWCARNKDTLIFNGIAGGLAATEMASSMIDINRLKKFDYSPLTGLQRAHDWAGGALRTLLESPLNDELNIPVDAAGSVADLGRVAAIVADLITRLVTMKKFNLSSSEVKKYNKNVQDLSDEQQAVFASRRKKMKALSLLQMFAKFAAASSGVACKNCDYGNKAAPALLGAGALGLASLSSIIYHVMYAKTVKNVLNKDEWVVNAKKAKATGDDFDDADQNDEDNDNFDGDED